MTSSADILVLGAGGPIGRAIARAAEPGRVVSASRSADVRVDADDADAVAALVSRVSPQAVIYLVNDRARSVEAAISQLRISLLVAQEQGVERFLFASSAAVYGDQRPGPLRESDPLESNTPYAEAKIRSEELVAAAGGLSTASLRIFNVCGPGCGDSLVNRLAFGPVPDLRVSDGFVRDYVHVDDVASAFLAATRRPDTQGPVNIGRGVAVDNLSLAARVPDGHYRRAGGGPDSFSVADVGRARTELGWVASIDPLEVLRPEVVAGP
ncbi:NAD-dependent epimerase/dehydratase family protein [Microbacterium hominis]|uniref:NAD-dependent epimerase/dehydratase family protein n=1 Tax=Microbacterium hominis TaxID=162426 RepID=UPI001965FC32|nr:NAD-dependent epimerase/dehydratase family protein [Microbacterium hominis]QRY41710.1 NAD-dependent epimerase/dehydratase family protein [Microbacterium hominis]